MTAAGLSYLAGRTGKSPRAIRAHAAWLIRHHGFPPPLPAAVVRADGLPRAPVWDRAQVDAWFDALAPRALADQLAGRALATWGRTLDARARNLGA